MLFYDNGVDCGMTWGVTRNKGEYETKTAAIARLQNERNCEYSKRYIVCNHERLTRAFPRDSYQYLLTVKGAG